MQGKTNQRRQHGTHLTTPFRHLVDKTAILGTRHTAHLGGEGCRSSLPPFSLKPSRVGSALRAARATPATWQRPPRKNSVRGEGAGRGRAALARIPCIARRVPLERPSCHQPHPRIPPHQRTFQIRTSDSNPNSHRKPTSAEPLPSTSIGAETTRTGFLLACRSRQRAP